MVFWSPSTPPPPEHPAERSPEPPVLTPTSPPEYFAPPSLQPLLARDPPRLHLLFPLRLALGNLAAVATGFTIGVTLGSKRASLRYRAENAHRLPTTTKDWYFYHKSKNYVVLKEGFLEGFKSSTRLCGWASLFLVTEAGVDAARGRVDGVSTAIAGGVTGGGFALINRMQMPTAVITVKKGLWMGFLYGFTQDLLKVAQGGRVFYISPLLPKSWRKTRESEESERELGVA